MNSFVIAIGVILAAGLIVFLGLRFKTPIERTERANTERANSFSPGAIIGGKRRRRK